MSRSFHATISAVLVAVLCGTPAVASVCAGLCGMSDWWARTAGAVADGSQAHHHASHRGHHDRTGAAAEVPERQQADPGAPGHDHHRHHHMGASQTGAVPAQASGRSHATGPTVGEAHAPCCDETPATLTALGPVERQGDGLAASPGAFFSPARSVYETRVTPRAGAPPSRSGTSRPLVLRI